MNESLQFRMAKPHTYSYEFECVVLYTTNSDIKTANSRVVGNNQYRF